MSDSEKGRRQQMAGRGDEGFSLIEVTMAIVVSGVVVSALAGAVMTGVRASQEHRDLVTVDLALRNYAESIKTAVANQCASGSTFSETYTPPSGFTAARVPNITTCPPATGPGSLQLVTLTVTETATSTAKSMQIMVRKP